MFGTLPAEGGYVNGVEYRSIGTYRHLNFVANFVGNSELGCLGCADKVCDKVCGKEMRTVLPAPLVRLPATRDVVVA
jgi:hypothetical protein